MAKSFKLCILFGDAPDRLSLQIVPGWELAFFQSDAVWAAQGAEIASWGLPPIKASNHFLHQYGLTATGPGADWEQLSFWTKRAFDRLAALGVTTQGATLDFGLENAKTSHYLQALRERVYAEQNCPLALCAVLAGVYRCPHLPGLTIDGCQNPCHIWPSCIPCTIGSIVARGGGRGF